MLPERRKLVPAYAPTPLDPFRTIQVNCGTEFAPIVPVIGKTKVIQHENERVDINKLDIR